MMKKLQKLLAIFAIFTISYAQLNNVNAESNGFTHTVLAEYNIAEDKSATVNFNFTTTNKISNNYLQNFSLKLPFNPQNISVLNSQTPINLKSVNQVNERLSEIQIEISQPVYGTDRQFNWGFSFTIPDIVIDHGMQKVIFIPTFSEDQNVTDYSISINVPDSLGEVRYNYGEVTTTRSDTTTNIFFTKSQIPTSSFSLLLGPNQDYFLETQVTSEEKELILPVDTPYQEVIFTQFPQRRLTLEDETSLEKIRLGPNDVVKAFIKTSLNYDTNYSESFEPISNVELVDSLVSNLNKDDEDKYALALSAYELVYQRYNSYDYLTTIDTIVDLSNPNKTLLNPAELNKLYREILTTLGIENKGVYGYVFPAQAFQKEIFTTEQHVWSEFWDGNRWVVVDPTWYIASRGTNYFDKNSFHHIKFGNYINFEDAKKFFANSNFVKVTPMTILQDVKKNLDLKIELRDENALDKNYKLILYNKSNKPVEFKKANLTTSGSNKIKLQKDSIEINKIIPPYSQIEIPVSFEYNLLLKKQLVGLETNLEYTLPNSSELEKVSQKNDLNFNSNISNYLTEVIILIIFVFLIVSIISFVLYKKKRRFRD